MYYLIRISPYTRMCAKSLQSCLTLCNTMDCSLSGSSVHGILQARILEWVAIPSSRGSFQSTVELYLLCLLHWQVGSLNHIHTHTQWFMLMASFHVRKTGLFSFFTMLYGYTSYACRISYLTQLTPTTQQ